MEEASFDIAIENEDLFTVLNDLSQRLANSWDKMYEYAKIYYEYHHNLEVPYKFKTNNGYDYDENGKVNLGTWINHQRQNLAPSSERGQKLLAIGMRFKNKFLIWDEMYEYAKIYYEYHGNLEVPQKFKTNNGYEYDVNGKINLGQWIDTQRYKVVPTSERVQKLLAIGMRFENKFLTWDEKYEYAKKYYEHHGNLEVPQKFKTNNGYEYDANGKVNLGTWIANQRQNLAPSSERGQKLLAIGMRFENIRSTLTWDEMYELAKKYYEKHGNLEVPHSFKTNNGYEYSEHGKINLGFWIATQRQSVAPTSEHGQKLLAIGMRFENKFLTWDEMYELAKKCYEKHGNLEVPRSFKTNNGYEYDENGKINLGKWIVKQREKVVPTSERGQKLIKIGMVFSVRKNKEDVKIFCLENYIDLEINKITLNHISIQELITKTRYLKEQNIDIVDANGLLHEIYSMSNVNMQVKYDISLEELIDRYYLTYSRK